MFLLPIRIFVQYFLRTGSIPGIAIATFHTHLSQGIQQLTVSVWKQRFIRTQLIITRPDRCRSRIGYSPDISFYGFIFRFKCINFKRFYSGIINFRIFKPFYSTLDRLNNSLVWIFDFHQKQININTFGIAHTWRFKFSSPCRSESYFVMLLTPGGEAAIILNLHV